MNNKCHSSATNCHSMSCIIENKNIVREKIKYFSKIANLSNDGFDYTDKNLCQSINVMLYHQGLSFKLQIEINVRFMFNFNIDHDDIKLNIFFDQSFQFKLTLTFTE